MCAYTEPLGLPSYIKFSPEFELLAACSWCPGSGREERQNQIIAILSQDSLNWNDVVMLVKRHDVIGQFCTNMVNLGWFNVPADISERLKSMRTDQAARALGQVAELARVGARFVSAGVDILPLKGVALSQKLYGNPCIRSSCDLDILVQPEDVSRSEELLIELGYRHELGFDEMNERQKLHKIETTHHHEYLNDITGIHIELHWRSYYWTKEQAAALWSTSGSSSWLNLGLRQLTTETTILFLMDHGARHNWSCIKWLSDVAMLVENLSEQAWYSLLDRAVFFDLKNIVIQTATLLQWFYCLELPQLIKESIESKPDVRKMSKRAAIRIISNVPTIFEKKFPELSTAFRVKQMKPKTSLIRLLRGSLVTSVDFKECRLPAGLFWLYAIMRPYFWFRRRFMNL